MSIALSGTAAVLALVLSVYSTVKTAQFNRKQEELIKAQAALNTLLIEREKAEIAEGKRADLGANFVKLGSNSYRLKVFNQGRSTARDVRIEFPEGNEIVSETDGELKFPLETLDRYQSVQLLASVHLNTIPKMALRLRWTDDFADNQSKILHPTL
ncbi:hypothetical protein AU476_19300 [Cupriavidus sp. UYMSc13B]|nr:hypothetical protein AU476_19300 [Cupriavidus sp. UYMSc13B]